MSALVDSRQLGGFVARIDGEDGRPLGSGFFAAPGWVVTCAHVVKDAATVAVVPADSHINTGNVKWQVAARSGPPEGGAALWPYPDLAVLRADGEVDHPCVLLDGRDPAGDQDCHAWGFARREDGIAPVGSPATFTFEGVEGDGFLRLKAGQAAPGLSGGPLVCPSRRAVVGVVTATRDPRTDLGGWAAPVSALLNGGEGVPAGLVEAGTLITTANRAAAIRYRREWNAVLPVDAEGVLAQPWSTFTRGPRSSPSSLLRADFGVVPYVFRDSALDEAVAWCEDAGWATPMAVARVAAWGGSGKTRFAIELCKRLIPLGWIAGVWRGSQEVFRVALPRLIIIDYAEETDLTRLQEALEALQRHASGMAPVRVLLLTRFRRGSAQDPLDTLLESAPATLGAVLDAGPDMLVASTPLTPEQRAGLHRAAIDAFTVAWDGSSRTGAAGAATPGPDLSMGRYGIPLEVLFEAFDQVFGGDIDSKSRPPADRALAHEEKYWRATAPHPRPDDGVLRGCVALATLAGADSDADASALLEVLEPLAANSAPTRRQLVDWLASLYDGPRKVNPLRPDRLGEALVARTLGDRGDHGYALLNGVLSLSSDAQVEQCLDVLARLSAYNDGVARVTAKVISQRLGELTLRAEAQARGLPDRPGPPGIAEALMRLLTGQLSTLVAKEQAAAEPLGREADPG